jgi:hypothetical protein
MVSPRARLPVPSIRSGEPEGGKARPPQINMEALRLAKKPLPIFSSLASVSTLVCLKSMLLTKKLHLHPIINGVIRLSRLQNNWNVWEC